MRIGRIAGITVGIAVLVIGGAYLARSSGEVVVLQTTDEQGERVHSRLWVVDHDGDPWVRPSDPSRTKWIDRLRANPRTELVRGERGQCRRAVFEDDPATREEVDRLFAERYRIPLYGSALLDLVSQDRPEAPRRVFIRLAPCR